MKAIQRITVMLLCIVLMASCGTRKSSVAKSNAKADSNVTLLQNIVQTVNANRQSETFVTAKATFAFQTGSKTTSLGGMLRMKRNDVIQLSLVTFGILEVARIEVTPEYFMIVDKMGKQYVKAAFRDIPFFEGANIDFHTLQSLFWGELFLLAESGTMPAEKQFAKSADGDKVTLVNADSRLAVLTFIVNAIDGLVRQVAVSSHRTGVPPYMTWDYVEFSPLGEKKFPTRHDISIAAGSRPFKATLSLSNLRNDSGWETRTDISGRSYKEITADKLMSYLMNLNR